MHLKTIVVGALCATLWLTLAHAQPATSQVTESADPAKIAAIERAAELLRKRPPQAPVEVVRGSTDAGYKFVVGGITVGDQETMQAQRQDYNLWVATVAMPSGAYLAEVDVRVTRLDKTPVLIMQRKMEGPWLMLALPEGRYEVSGSFRESDADKEQVIAMRVNVLKKGLRQTVLRFISAADVDSQAQRPFGSNPFDEPAPTPSPKPAN